MIVKRACLTLNTDKRATKVTLLTMPGSSHGFIEVMGIGGLSFEMQVIAPGDGGQGVNEEPQTIL